MILEEVYAVFKKNLPDRSTVRNHPDIIFRNINKEYTSWTRFVKAYENYVQERIAALKVKKDEV